MAERIGDILVRRGSCMPREITQALLHQQGNPGRICGHLLTLKLCTERMLAEALAEQMGLPAVVLSASALSRSTLGLIPPEVCRGEALLPVWVDDVSLTVAFGGPPSARLLTEIAFAMGRRVIPAVAVETSVLDMVERLLADGGNAVVRGSAWSRNVTTVPPGGFVEVVHPPPPVGLIEPSGPETMRAASPGTGGWPVPPRVDKLAAQVSQPAPAVHGRRVLVVDDVAELRVMVRRVLEQDGYVMAEAGSGFEAIRQIQFFAPELIILDAMLPEVHGFEICQSLKQSPVLCRIPVIMVSAIYKGWDYARDIQEVYGVDLFLEKPFDVNLLRDRVRSMLASAPTKEGWARPGTGAGIREEVHGYLGRGDHQAAVDACERGLRLDPFNAELHALKALAYERLGHVQHAMVGYERSLELQPDNYPVLKNLALLYERLGFRRKASTAWQRALELCTEPDFKERIRMRLMMGLQG